ncbi:MAG: oxidoreductase [Candidatus Thorarchaeota archaeon]|jgi:2,4-dienoyl-CoA reductase (NADPH2)
MLDSVAIGSLQLQNRLVFLATHLGYCGEDGVVTDQLVEFYRERAQHRPGLIIVGGCYTERYGSSGPTMIGISRNEHIKGLSRLADAIHSFDVPVAAQLYHAGRYVHSMILGEQAVSASAVPCRLTRETPRALSIEEIMNTVANFGQAAERAKKSGFDAVEIIGSAGYLINQFLAQATNKRDDEYGGDLESRAKFALEVVRSVRDTVGPDFPVIYRMSGDDFVEEGNTLDDNKIVAPWLVDAGADCINVTGGWHETHVPQLTMNVPRGHFAYLAEGIADVVDVPVVACNRINSLTVAERILARGKADLIGMCRGFLSDSAIMEKIRSGLSNRIRTCIGCNQGCLDNVFLLQGVTCAINPEAGYELKRKLGPKGKGNVAIIGAGVAGLEAARVLALRGFKATLFDENNRVGGLLNLASRIPGRGEFAAYVIHQLREMKRLRVELRLGFKVGGESIAAAEYDRVVFAGGTHTSAPPIEGVELPHVATVRDMVERSPDNLGRVAVIGGNALGCYASIFLISRAESVALFEKRDGIGRDLGRTTRWVILKAMAEKGVTFHVNAEIAQIAKDYVQVSSKEELTLVGIDTVIVAARPRPRTRFVEAATENGLQIDVIGSAAGHEWLVDIVHGAYDYANKLFL